MPTLAELWEASGDHEFPASDHSLYFSTGITGGHSMDAAKRLEHLYRIYIEIYKNNLEMVLWFWGGVIFKEGNLAWEIAGLFYCQFK